MGYIEPHYPFLLEITGSFVSRHCLRALFVGICFRRACFLEFELLHLFHGVLSSVAGYCLRGYGSTFAFCEWAALLLIERAGDTFLRLILDPSSS